RARLNAERKRVAMSPRPDEPVLSSRHGKERIVGWNLTGRIRYGVHADDLAKQVVQCLRVTPGRVIAVGRIEFSIHAEVQCAAIVVGRAAQVVEVEEYDFTHGRVSNISVCREATDAIVNGWRGRRIEQIHKLIGEEVGIEGDAQEPTLAR